MEVHMAKRRLKLSFSEQGAERLDRLKGKVRAESDLDIILNALQVYEALVDGAQEGKKIVLHDTRNPSVTERILLMGVSV
jgi:hypothetical protein